MSQLHFYADKEDFLPLSDMVDASGALLYAPCGNFSGIEWEAGIRSFNAINQLPNLGIATASGALACVTYLVSHKDVPISTRVLQGKDGDRFLIDQLLNPDTVCFTPGGWWGEDILLYGRIATVSKTVMSNKLYQVFRNGFRKLFVNIKGTFVGRSALCALKAGKRLTLSVQSSREFDLAL